MNNIKMAMRVVAFNNMSFTSKFNVSRALFQEIKNRHYDDVHVDEWDLVSISRAHDLSQALRPYAYGFISDFDQDEFIRFIITVMIDIRADTMERGLTFVSKQDMLDAIPKI